MRGELSHGKLHSNGENHRGGPLSASINSLACSKYSFQPLRLCLSFFTGTRSVDMANRGTMLIIPPDFTFKTLDGCTWRKRGEKMPGKKHAPAATMAVGKSDLKLKQFGIQWFCNSMIIINMTINLNMKVGYIYSMYMMK